MAWLAGPSGAARGQGPSFPANLTTARCCRAAPRRRHHRRGHRSAPTRLRQGVFCDNRHHGALRPRRALVSPPGRPHRRGALRPQLPGALPRRAPARRHLLLASTRCRLRGWSTGGACGHARRGVPQVPLLLPLKRCHPPHPASAQAPPSTPAATRGLPSWRAGLPLLARPQRLPRHGCAWEQRRAIALSLRARRPRHRCMHKEGGVAPANRPAPLRRVAVLPAHRPDLLSFAPAAQPTQRWSHAPASMHTFSTPVAGSATRSRATPSRWRASAARRLARSSCGTSAAPLARAKASRCGARRVPAAPPTSPPPPAAVRASRWCSAQTAATGEETAGLAGLPTLAPSPAPSCWRPPPMPTAPAAGWARPSAAATGGCSCTAATTLRQRWCGAWTSLTRQAPEPLCACTGRRACVAGNQRDCAFS